MTPEAIRDLYIEVIAIGIYEGERRTATDMPGWSICKNQEWYRGTALDAVDGLATNALLPTIEEQQGDYQIQNGAGEIVGEHLGERRFVTPWKDIPRCVTG